MDVHAFLRNGLEERPDSPDGRPLFAYRCTREEFDQIKADLRRTFWLARRFDQDTAALLVLAGAEWWRRAYNGGPWSWQVLMANVVRTSCSYQRTVTLVRQGLQFWRRPVLQGRDGSARWLETLAREGGMPLRLVHGREADSRYLRFFRAVFEDLRIYGLAGGRTVDTVAEGAEAHKGYLPRTFQNDTTYLLAAELACEIWDLRRHHGLDDQEDPVAWLDQVDADWRHRIPLLLEDDTARHFLKGLVREAGEVARSVRGRIRVVTRLCGWPGSPRIERRLVAPARIDDSVLAAFLERDGTEALPRRLSVRLYLQGAPASGVHGRLLRRSDPSADGRTSWILSSPERKVLAITGEDAAGDIEVEVSAGGRLVGRAVAFDGASALPDLPWVFRPSVDEQDTWELIGTGTCSTRSQEVLILVPRGWEVRPGAGTLVSEGEVSGLDRVAWRLTGSARLTCRDRLVRVKTSVDEHDEHGADFHFRGRRFDVPGHSRVVWRGLPTPCETTSVGDVISVPADSMRYTPRSARDWTRDPAGCYGEVRYRYLREDAVAGEGTLSVVPEDLTWHMEVRPDEGAISLTSRHLRRVGVLRGETPASGKASGGTLVRSALEEDSPPSFDAWDGTCRVEPVPGGFRVVVKATSGLPQRIWLRLDVGGRIDISFPCPIERAGFVAPDGRALQPNQALHLSTMDRVHAYVLTPIARIEPRLCATVLFEHSKLEVTAPIPATGDNVYDLPLRHVLPDVERLLSVSETFDSEVTLSVIIPGGNGDRRHRVRVRRYDWVLRRDEDNAQVVLEGVSGPLPEDVVVEARPLRDIARAVRLSLQGEEGGPHRFRFPYRAFEPGTWIITARQGAWYRGRPLAWTIGEQAAPFTASRPSVLARAMEALPAGIRRKELFQALEPLGGNIEHADWKILEGFLEVAGDIPPASFDVLRCMSRLPGVCAMAAARVMPGEHLEGVWAAALRFPFLWELVPLWAWEDAFEAYRQQMVRGFAGRGDRGRDAVTALMDAGVRRLADELPTLPLVYARWAERHRLDHAFHSDNSVLAARGGGGDQCLRELLAGEIKALRNRHPEEQWPNCPGDVYKTIERLALAGRFVEAGEAALPGQAAQPVFSYSIIMAPAAVASAAFRGQGVARRAIFYIREFKAFDPEYFDAAHGLCLTWLLRRAWADAPVRGPSMPPSATGREDVQDNVEPTHRWGNDLPEDQVVRRRGRRRSPRRWDTPPLTGVAAAARPQVTEGDDDARFESDR